MQHSNPGSPSKLPKEKQILNINFNQDQGCFAVSTEKGFRIYNTDPYKLTIDRDMDAGVGYIEMLYRSNIFALIGGGRNPKKPLNKVILWEDNQQKIVGEMTFKSDVRSVRMREKKFVVVLSNEIFVYNFADLSLDQHIETCNNPKGLCALNNDVTNTMLASPDKKTGHVLIQLYDLHKKTTIKAHQSALSFLELSAQGTKIATSSEKGTVIRIFNPIDGSQLQELRRGLEYAQIYSLAFDGAGRHLAMSCDSGTIHIYNLKPTKEDLEQQQEAENTKEEENDVNAIEDHPKEEATKKKIKNPTSKFLKFIMPYFDSEWSFAKFKATEKRTKVGFGPEPNSIVAVGYDGMYYHAVFDPIKGGDCDLVETLNIFDK